ncbi:MAG: Fic family protein [Nanoarchaeota archaeon]
MSATFFEKVHQIIKDCHGLQGDVYDKAVVLLIGLVQKHPFGSGNRRTAVIVVKDFLESNGARLGIADNPSQARILLGIREGFYSTAEIKEWIKHGKIREFKR